MQFGAWFANNAGRLSKTYQASRRLSAIAELLVCIQYHSGLWKADRFRVNATPRYYLPW